jgi:hypothetical protein
MQDFDELLLVSEHKGNGNGQVHEKDVEKIVENAGPDIVFVTPSQLATLYKQARTSSAPAATTERRP